MPGRECIYEKEDYNLDRGQNTCFFVLKCSQRDLEYHLTTHNVFWMMNVYGMLSFTFNS